MALALNVFKTITQVAPTSSVGIYTASVGYSGVVLLAQAANVGSSTKTVSLSHVRTTAGIAVTTEIIKDCQLKQVILQIYFQVNLSVSQVILLNYLQVMQLTLNF